MGGFVKGDVVVVPFPFTDLSGAKRRPALVLAALAQDDYILCQITSQRVSDALAVEIGEKDFESGKLAKMSNARPNRVFTTHESLILYTAGHLKPERTDAVVNGLIRILQA